MANWNDLKTTNAGYFPLVLGIPSWKLSVPLNIWDVHIDAHANWYDNVNGNQKNLSALGILSFFSGVGYLASPVGVNTANPNVPLDVNGAMALRVLDVTLANGLNSNINIGTSGHVRFIGPTAPASIGGFTGGTDGRILFAHFGYINQTTIVNNDVSSSAANRIATSTGANVVFPGANGSFAIFMYSSINNSWLLFAAQG